MDTPRIMPIAAITDENSSVKTFWFDYDLRSEPGQFVMLWIPGLDQKPFSIAYDQSGRFGLSIFAVGPLSSKLFELRPGDRVGISGPYGNPFTIFPNTHYITVGGGYGAGPLGILVERLAEHNCTVDFCVGARNKNLLLFIDRVKDLPHVTVHTATDDGTTGHHGYVTNLLEQLLVNQSTNKPINVSACGPELMEKKVLDICNRFDVNCEISVERYMKCGFGVCGQCTVDDSGIRMCVEGPVVDRSTANGIKEFGSYHRDKAGAKHSY